MVDNSQRDLHGALLDSEILADVFLLMTVARRKCLGCLDQERIKQGVREFNCAH